MRTDHENPMSLTGKFLRLPRDGNAAACITGPDRNGTAGTTCCPVRDRLRNMP